MIGKRFLGNVCLAVGFLLLSASSKAQIGTSTPDPNFAEEVRMVQRPCFVRKLTRLLLFASCPSAVLGQHWDVPKRDACVAPGLRQYSAILRDIPAGTSWEAACSSTPASVAGQSFARPSRCVNLGLFGMWGEFDVNDTSCNARWDHPSSNGCTNYGVRTYSSRLEDIPPGITWEAACNATYCSWPVPELVSSSFGKASRCINKGLFGMWGEWDVSTDGCKGHDVVAVENVYLRAGILVDGHPTNSSDANDLGFVGATNDYQITQLKFDVGIMDPAFPGSNEIFAFGQARAPAWLNGPWTTQRDTPSIRLRDIVPVDVTFWIIAGDFKAERENARLSVFASNAIWDKEAAGVWFHTFEFKDATANPNASRYLDGPIDNMAIRKDIGFDEGRINLYVVRSLQGFGGLQPAGLPQAYLIDGFSGSLLAHEMGHIFVLEHVGDDVDHFNLMTPGVTGTFLTEGQVFRMHFHPSSAINFLIEPGQIKPLRVCPNTAADDQCVSVRKRLWADGNLPPN